MYKHTHRGTKKYTHLLFLYTNLGEDYGPWKSLLSDWVHSRWAHRKAMTQAATFPPLSRNLCGHGGGEPGHDRIERAQFSPAHPHVLFPQQFVLYWPLSVHCHYPQNAGELCDREEDYLLPSMYDSTLLLPCFGYIRMSYVACNGIGPLSYHL